MTKINFLLIVSLLVLGSLPVVGMAAEVTVEAGDLIKSPEYSAVYYLTDEGKRLVFPNFKTYRTWYKDFSRVKTISLEELQSYPLGGNATYRPGTKLVKITTDPKVYAIEPGGVLRWLTTEEIFLGLGYSFDMVEDVPDAFFTNYTIGDPIESLVHPTGTVVRFKDWGSYHIIQNGQRRLIRGEGSVVNNVDTSYALLEMTNADSYPAGDDLLFEEAWLSDPGYTGGQDQGSHEPFEEEVNISLNIENIEVSFEDDILAGKTVRPFKFKLTNDGDGSVKLTNIKIKQVGALNEEDFNNIKLVDSQENGLASLMWSSNNEMDLQLITPLEIVEGGEENLELEVTILTSAKGKDFQFEIENVNFVSAKDEDGVSVSVKGDYPISGIKQSISNYFLYYVDGVTVSLNYDSTTSGEIPALFDDLSLIKFDAISTTADDLQIDSIELDLLATDHQTDLWHWALFSKLYKNNTESMQMDYEIEDGKLIFTPLDGHTYKLLTDEEVAFTVKVDITGDADLGNTFQLKMKDAGAGLKVTNMTGTSEPVVNGNALGAEMTIGY